MNAQNVMDAKKQSDWNNVEKLLLNYKSDAAGINYTVAKIFKFFTPKQYQPFEVSDFNEFMLKQVRRKGEAFNGEVWIVEGCVDILKYPLPPKVMVTTQINETEFSTDLKLFSTMFDEWEFINGDVFGKLI